MKDQAEAKELFDRLIKIIAKLRDPQGGCPWDLEQTHDSLKQYVVEEAYEVVEAIEQEPGKLCEELGDLLLQVMLHSQIGSEQGSFKIADVICTLCDKLVKRHPHVFGALKVDSSREVLKNWEAIKKKDRGEAVGMLDGIPKSMPSLLKAHRIGQKVARVDFDWPDLKSLREKVSEELYEFLNSLEEGSTEHTKEELGDLLFTLAQLARKMDFNAEEVLNQACRKFGVRFRKMEEIAGPAIKDLGRAGLEELWGRVK